MLRASCRVCVEILHHSWREVIASWGERRRLVEMRVERKSGACNGRLDRVGGNPKEFHCEDAMSFVEVSGGVRVLCGTRGRMFGKGCRAGR
jgi:hypothetical protein